MSSVKRIQFTTQIDAPVNRVFRLMIDPESYTFQAASAGTKLIIDQGVTEEFEACMAEAWPKALNQLKTICEAESAA